MGWDRRTVVVFALTAVLLGLLRASEPAGAAVIGLDASTQVVQIDSNTSGLNNSVALVDVPGPVTVTATGNASFGSNPGEIYNAVAISYRDLSGLAQYAVAQMNQPGVTISGSHYHAALLTDNQGQHVGNTGTTTITQSNGGGTISTGTIVAGSTTSAQTGVAQLSFANAAVFNTSPVGVPQWFNVTVTGQAFWGPGPNDQYGSVVVQHRDATNGITYHAQPIGTTQSYFGFNLRVFITDLAGQTGDNSGALTVDLQVPEPASMGMLGVAAAAVLPRRRRCNRSRPA